MNIKFNPNKKKIVTAALSLALLASPIAAYGETQMEVRPISADLEVIPIRAEGELMPIMAEEEVPNYIEFNGKISRLDSKEDLLSILAENDLEEGMDKLVAHISDDVLLLDEESMDFISKEDLEEGMEVSIYYDKDTIMLMSYPAQLGPDLVIVRSDDLDVNIKIDKFDEDLTSDDNSLKLNIDEDTELINLQGEKIEKEDLANKDLIVFYTNSTRSIPAQTTPQKVIAFRNHDVNVLHYLNLNGSRLNLDNLMYKTEDNDLMVPLRQIAEVLDFNVSWDQESKSVKLDKDGYSSSLRIGSNEYLYYDMILELRAPELTDKTYVPLKFVKDILLADIEVTMNGVLEITKY